MEYLKALHRQSLLYGVGYVLLGAFLIFWPHVTLRLLARLLSFVGLAAGIIRLLRFTFGNRGTADASLHLALGVLLVIISVFFLIRAEVLVSMIAVLLGLGVVADGVMKLKSGFDMKRNQFQWWSGVVLLAVITIGLGVVVLINPSKTMSAFMILTGISLLVGGVGNLIIAWRLQRQIKEYRFRPEDWI